MNDSPPFAVHAPRLAGKRLLVVEDSPDALEALCVLLQFEGASVQIARDGQEALERLGEIEVDLMLADLEMPRLDGFGLVAALRRDPAITPLPCIALTARGLDSDVERALAAGFDAHVTKPVMLDDLVAVISRLLPA